LGYQKKEREIESKDKMDDEDEYVDIEMLSESDGDYQDAQYESSYYDESVPSLLLALPDDVIFYIASFLTPRDLTKVFCLLHLPLLHRYL